MPYKAVIFDIDGTITTPVSSWRYIHEKLGKWDVLAFRYQEQFLAGRISYRKFCELDAAHWKGLPEQHIRGMFADIPFAGNARQCLRRLRKEGFKLLGISTGLQYVIERVEREVPFDAVLSNRLKVRDGMLTGQVEINIAHRAKGRVVRRLLQPLGIDPAEAIAVGDSDGDVPMAKACGYSIAFNSTGEKLNRAVDYVCRTRDFREVCERILRCSDMSRTPTLSLPPRGGGRG